MQDSREDSPAFFILRHDFRSIIYRYERPTLISKTTYFFVAYSSVTKQYINC